MQKKIIAISGFQPSGLLTIGHYISILSKLNIDAEKYEFLFCIADLHSMTNFKNKILIKKNILDLISIIISINKNFSKNIIFLQSNIKEHLKLFWILSCFVKFNDIKKMYQFKKNIKINNLVNIGILTYPILMAADILLYNSNLVYIGYDQVQHIELVKKIAINFNKIYGNIFNIPNYILFNKYCIMSLSNPLKKMSKSSNNKNSYISLLDDYNTISNKIYKSVTDSNSPPIVKFDKINKPGISNLLNIASSIENISINDIENEFYNKNYNYFKKYIINILNKKIDKIRKRFYKIRKNELFLNKIINSGNNKVRKIANFRFNYINNKYFDI